MNLEQFQNQFYESLLTWRRHLHQNPELSWEEYETTAYIEQVLRKIGITAIQKPLKTGLIALIEGKNPSKKCVALRADIDALPIQEANVCEYKSTKEGVMHACGHDVHSTCLLGAAQYLWNHREDFEGTIKLIFQPSEEKQPSGAEALIEAGALANPSVSSIIGLHVTPELETGKLGFRKGKFMASADEIYMTVHGKGGHAASPHLCIDPIIISANILIALQQLVSRYSNPITPTVLSFGDIHGFGATNIIPEKVTLKGTLRTFDEAWREVLHSKINSICQNIAESFGGSCEIDIPKGLSYVNNDDRITETIQNVAIELLGKEQVVEMPIRMGAEDFSAYGHQIPSSFFRLGTGNIAKNITATVHNPKFDIDENALSIGALAMAKMGMQLLED
jgi:amidohydrolase